MEKYFICEECEEPVHFSEKIHKWYHDERPRLQDSHAVIPVKAD